jgi:putative endonuclease
MMSVSKKSVSPARWRLYILRCFDNTFYTGITNDLARRLEQHNNGKASRYTRSRRPVRVIHQEGCRNKSSALKKECRVKALSREEKEAYIKRKGELVERAQTIRRFRRLTRGKILTAPG